MNTITILGSGTSSGIPMIGCSCEVCSSPLERNKRMRTSILLETGKGNSFLVDTTPDFRSQYLNNKILKIDAVIITHEHADHLHGIDDLRPLNYGTSGKIMPVYTFTECANKIKKKFDYIFLEVDVRAGSKPMIDILEVSPNFQTLIFDEPFDFHLLPHGPFKTLGFQFGKFAYFVDISEMPRSLITQLKNAQLDLLIIDCVQKRPHKTHLNLDQSFSLIQDISPQSAGLIHMNHELEHNWLENQCLKKFGPRVFPTYDGQKLYFS